VPKLEFKGAHKNWRNSAHAWASTFGNSEIAKSHPWIEDASSGSREPFGLSKSTGQDGLFVPINIPGGLDKLASDAKIDEAFIEILKRFNAQGRNASSTTGTSYAPALFAREPEGQGVASKQFEASMTRLFKGEKIHRVNNGCKSKPSWTLVPTETSAPESE
jgi:hypothetical protein